MTATNPHPGDCRQCGRPTRTAGDGTPAIHAAVTVAEFVAIDHAADPVPYPTARDDIRNATGAGFRDGSTNPTRDAGILTAAAHEAALARGAAIARAGLTDDDLADRAAEYGIVPDVDRLPIDCKPYQRADARQRVAELVDTYGAWRAQAINAHAWRMFDAAYSPTMPAGALAGLAVDFRGWPGDVAAEYDASAERYNLSPSGPWGDALPPIYAAVTQTEYARAMHDDANRPNR